MARNAVTAPVSAVERHQRRDAREMEDHPLDPGGHEIHGNEARARLREDQDVVSVDARGRPEDLPP